VTVSKAKDIGVMPTYLMLAQKHLEKAVPMGEVGDGGATTYQIPTDLLTVGDAVEKRLVEEIDSIELTYQKRGR
jgi:hypothetical protein